MEKFYGEIDITKKIMNIEYLKSEMLTSVADIYKILSMGINPDLNMEIRDELSKVISISYILGRKIGVSYSDIDKKIAQTLKEGLPGVFEEDADDLLKYLQQG